MMLVLSLVCQYHSQAICWKDHSKEKPLVSARGYLTKTRSRKCS